MSALRWPNRLYLIAEFNKENNHQIDLYLDCEIYLSVWGFVYHGYKYPQELKLLKLEKQFFVW